MESNNIRILSESEIADFLKTGTTTVGIIYNGGLVLATESQATAGYFVATKRAQKLFKINQYIGVTISGGVADCQYVIGQAKAYANLRKVETGRPAEPRYIANIIRNFLFQGRSYFLAMMIVGGYSSREKRPVLYGLDLLGTLVEEKKYLSYGSGSPYALGVIEAEWKQDLKEEDAIKIAKTAITSARNRDAGSGYGIQMVKITSEGFFPVEGFHGD